MAVDAERDGDRGVAEALLDHSRVDTPLERECRPRVAEAMKSEPWEAAAADPAEEAVAHGVRAEPGPVRPVEDEAEIVEVGADKEPLLKHPMTVLPQCRDGPRIERHRAAAPGRLRLTDGDDTAGLNDGLHDPDPASVEVDVGHRRPRASPRRMPVVASRTQRP